MSEVIALISAKGGAGKTSIAVNLAHAYASCGIRVLLIDCDINTYGATAFYRQKEDVKNQLNNCITFQEILQSFLYPGIINPDDEIQFEKWGVSVEECLDFISGGKYLVQGNTETKVKERYDYLQVSLAKLIDKWTEKYDVLIMDQSAGYNSLINVMVSFATEVLIVREYDRVSLELSRDLFERVGTTGKHIVSCVNKIPKSRYKSIRNDNEEDILTRCIGFKYNYEFIRRMENGENIELWPESFEEDDNSYTENGSALARIAKSVLREKEKNLSGYLQNIEEKTEKERQERLERIAKEEQERLERIEEEEKERAEIKDGLLKKLIVNTIMAIILGVGGGVSFYIIQNANFKLSMSTGIWASIGIGFLILFLSWLFMFIYLCTKNQKYTEYIKERFDKFLDEYEEDE